MATPVNLSAFEHKEETFFVFLHEIVYATFRNLFKRQVAGLAVKRVWQTACVYFCSLFGLEKDYFVGFLFFFLEVLQAAGYGISAFLCEFIEVFVVFHGFQKFRTGKEIEFGVD